MLLTCTPSTDLMPSPKIFQPQQIFRKGVPQARTQMICQYTVRLPPPSHKRRITPQFDSGAPTLYYIKGDTYTEIYPATFKTYYENIDRAEIPFPRDLHMVAGNASAKSQADINEKVTAITWWCDTGADDRNSRARAAFPRGTCGAHMQAILRFGSET